MHNFLADSLPLIWRQIYAVIEKRNAVYRITFAMYHNFAVDLLHISSKNFTTT